MTPVWGGDPPDADDPAYGSRAEPVGDALAAYLRSRGLQAAGDLAQILVEWEAAAGPLIAKHTRPVAMRDRELVCEADSAAFATELRLAAYAVLSRLETQLGERLADQLTVRVSRGSGGA